MLQGFSWVTYPIIFYSCTFYNTIYLTMYTILNISNTLIKIRPTVENVLFLKSCRKIEKSINEASDIKSQKVGSQIFYFIKSGGCLIFLNNFFPFKLPSHIVTCKQLILLCFCGPNPALTKDNRSSIRHTTSSEIPVQRNGTWIRKGY